MPAYGNVPDDDVQALRSAVRIASAVAAQLPPNAPPDWRGVAYEAVLNGILKDWVTNGTNNLDEGDEEDITNLMRVAADIAVEQDAASRDVTFRVLLKNAMADWVENWNLDE